MTAEKSLRMEVVFIGGCSRSGTTLLAAMLGIHSKLLAVPESHFKTEVSAVAEDGAESIDLGQKLEHILKHHRFKHWGLQPFDKAHILRKSDGSFPNLIENLVLEYGRQKTVDKTPDMWVDHTPSNVQFARRLNALFPHMRMIHLVRDGRAVAASILPLDWGPNTVYSAARFWLAHLSHGLAAETYLGAKKVLRIRYEDLVSNPEKTLMHICRFLHIGWEPQMVSGKGFVVPRYTTAQHRLVGSPPDAGRIRRWETSLDQRQIRIFEAVTGDMLAYLGYALNDPHGVKYPGILTRFAYELKDVMKCYLINSVKHAIRRHATKH